jgi:hypothetical protein
LVKRLPQVFGHSIDESLEPKLSWLQQRLSLDDASLSVVVQQMQSILGSSVETNLEPRIKFYEECVGLDATRTFIANNPRLLGSSLEKRLKARHAECQEAGVPIDTGTLQRIAMHAEDLWSNAMAFQKTKLLKQQLLNRSQQLLDG